MDTAPGLTITELKPGFGAEILGLDLSTANDAKVDAVVEVFNLHGAILLRNQDLSPDQLVKFIARFNQPEGHTQKQFTLPGYPYIFILSNKVVDGKPLGAHNDGVGWHTD